LKQLASHLATAGMIALRTFDEMPCGFGVSTKASWLFSKTHTTRVSSGSSVAARTRKNTRRLRLSFSLNDVNQHANTTQTRAKNTPDPLSGRPAVSRQIVSADNKVHSAQRAASLSDRAYKCPLTNMSSITISKL
jgi:hypothetical protein